MDAVHIVQDNVKKALEVWINDGDDDDDGNNGGDNIIGNDKNSFNERNEKKND